MLLSGGKSETLRVPANMPGRSAALFNAERGEQMNQVQRIWCRVAAAEASTEAPRKQGKTPDRRHTSSTSRVPRGGLQVVTSSSAPIIWSLVLKTARLARNWFFATS